MWTLHQQQQHCGAQLHARSRPSKGSGPRQPGEIPAEAAQGRSAQEHDRADLDAGGEALQPGDYPASPIEHRDGDPSTGLRTGNTPTAPGDTRVEWDEVVQPEQRRSDDLPLPEGK
jgi:hypothetical protein